MKEKINIFFIILLVLNLFFSLLIIFLIGIPTNNQLLKRKIAPTGLYRQIRQLDNEVYDCAQSSEIPDYGNDIAEIKDTLDTIMRDNDITEIKEKVEAICDKINCGWF